MSSLLVTDHIQWHVSLFDLTDSDLDESHDKVIRQMQEDLYHYNQTVTANR